MSARKLNQAAVIRLILPDYFQVHAKLVNLARAIKPGDVGNFEAQASKIYFTTIFGEDFTRRSNAEINGLLNYCYSIVRSYIAKCVVANGLMPAIGVFHHSELNAFNLVDDLIELYRAYVDLYVWHIIEKDFDALQLTSKTKYALIDILYHVILVNGQSTTVMTSVDLVIQSLNAALKNKNPQLLKLPALPSQIERSNLD